MNDLKVFEQPEIYLHPKPEAVLALIKQHGGMSMAALHALGYRSVFDSLQYLLDEELVFKHNDIYLPNT